MRISDHMVRNQNVRHRVDDQDNYVCKCTKWAKFLNKNTQADNLTVKMWSVKYTSKWILNI